MASTAKKRRRRLARRGRLDLLASDDSPVLLVADVEAAAPGLEPVTIEAAESDNDGPPKLRARAYNGGPMRPRVSGLSTGGLPIVIDLKGARVDRNGRKLPVLFGHDRSDPIGHTTRVHVGATITAEGVLSVPGASRDKVVGASGGGFIWAVSIGFEATELEFIGSTETATVNGRTLRGPAYIARRGHLREISLLSIGAERTASATVSATSGTLPPSESLSMNPELRAFIEAAGFNPDEITDAQVEYFRAQHEATIEAGEGNGDPPGDPPHNPTPRPQPQRQPAQQPVQVEAGEDEDPMVAFRRERAAEIDRCNRITAICAEHGNPSVQIQGTARPLEAIAIEAGYSVERAELEAMRAARPQAPAAHSNGRNRTHTIEALGAGLMMRAGVDLEDKWFQTPAAIEAGAPAWVRAGHNSDQFGRTMDSARMFRSATLLEIAATATEIESGSRPIGRMATIEAAFSSGSFANLVGTTVGARALQAFNEVRDTTSSFVSRGTVPDFEEHDTPGLDAMESLEHLPAGKEANHAKRSAHNEKRQAARYAKQYMLDEQDLIGDRLRLLSSTPQGMGRAAGRMVPDLVYWLLLSNPTMLRTGRAAFHTDDGTLLSAAAFGKASLSTAISSLMKQKDGDSTLNLQPTHVVTGTELADDVVQLTGSAIFTNDSGAGARNPLARYGIEPVADARISNGVKHPKTGVMATGSATAFFVASTDGEGIEVVTVDGTGGVPRVRVTNMTHGKWGINIDVVYDVGAQFIENRTWRKNAGA